MPHSHRPTRKRSLGCVGGQALSRIVQSPQGLLMHLTGEFSTESEARQKHCPVCQPISLCCRPPARPPCPQFRKLNSSLYSFPITSSFSEGVQTFSPTVKSRGRETPVPRWVVTFHSVSLVKCCQFSELISCPMG